jgi:hypothetical protein
VFRACGGVVKLVGSQNLFSRGLERERESSLEKRKVAVLAPIELEGGGRLADGVTALPSY